ncbi:hypothetical protein DIPPA_20756 [Diplonema papillatum]|nr:hypothetical protein DIPPA_20756 [Diplonema papillatum]
MTILATPWAIEELKRWKRSWQAAEAVRSSRRAFARAMCRSSVIAPGHQAPNVSTTSGTARHSRGSGSFAMILL